MIKALSTRKLLFLGLILIPWEIPVILFLTTLYTLLF